MGERHPNKSVVLAVRKDFQQMKSSSRFLSNVTTNGTSAFDLNYRKQNGQRTTRDEASESLAEAIARVLEDWLNSLRSL